MDEQLLASAAARLQEEDDEEPKGNTALSPVNRQPSSFAHSRLLNYSGQVHVHDLALMLEEILYYYRPEGTALAPELLRDVLTRYDEWVDTVAEPMDLEVLTAVHSVLEPPPSPAPEKSHRRGLRSTISHHISHNLSFSFSRSKSRDVEESVLTRSEEDVLYRGHFQQHEMVKSTMHFDILALELKEHSPSMTPTSTTSGEAAGNTFFNASTKFTKNNSIKASSRGRYSCKWRDIRRVLDAETQRLQEAEKSILGAALRGLSGRQKLSMAERMTARRFGSGQPATKLHIAHATVSFQLFVSFLHDTLAAQEE